MGIFDKAKDLASQNPDAVEGGLSQAQQFASEKTGGQYDEQLNKAHDMARSQMGMGERQQEEQGQQDQGLQDQQQGLEGQQESFEQPTEGTESFEQSNQAGQFEQSGDEQF